MHINQIKKILIQWEKDADAVALVYQPNSNQLSEHVWQIGTSYYLKMFDTLADLQKELAILRQSQREQSIYPTISGNEFIEFHGSYFMLSAKFSGRPILSAEALERPAAGRHIGKIIGQITVQLSDIAGEFPETNLLETLLNFTLPKISQKLDLSPKWIKSFQTDITELFPSLPRQLIHRDLHGGNILVSDSDYKVIDFDFVEVNFRIYDLCYYLTSVLSEQFDKRTFKGEQWMKLALEVLTGYSQVVKITEQEKQAIPYVILTDQLITVAYFAEYEKYRQLFQVNEKITYWLIEKTDELKEIIATI